ncbi:MAG: archaellin/type IV pilin N-terminal domain-containing protein [Ignisphaera sp.]
MKNKLYKGIEPIIAVVILVAITLVIAIGVIGWIMGWWGTFGATESLKIYPDSYIQVKSGNNNDVLILHIKNEGSAAAVIYKIEVVGLKTIDNVVGALNNSIPTSFSAQGNDLVIPPGAEDTAEINLNVDAIAGTNYKVNIYTRAGNVIPATVQAKTSTT